MIFPFQLLLLPLNLRRCRVLFFILVSVHSSDKYFHFSATLPTSLSTSGLRSLSAMWKAKEKKQAMYQENRAVQCFTPDTMSIQLVSFSESTKRTELWISVKSSISRCNSTHERVETTYNSHICFLFAVSDQLLSFKVRFNLVKISVTHSCPARLVIHFALVGISGKVL